MSVFSDLITCVRVDERPNRQGRAAFLKLVTYLWRSPEALLCLRACLRNGSYGCCTENCVLEGSSVCDTFVYLSKHNHGTQHAWIPHALFTLKGTACPLNKPFTPPNAI